jgi:hypothetical protein
MLPNDPLRTRVLTPDGPAPLPGDTRLCPKPTYMRLLRGASLGSKPILCKRSAGQPLCFRFGARVRRRNFERARQLGGVTLPIAGQGRKPKQHTRDNQS